MPVFKSDWFGDSLGRVMRPHGLGRNPASVTFATLYSIQHFPSQFAYSSALGYEPPFPPLSLIVA
jgi:hypothetical protein